MAVTLEHWPADNVDTDPWEFFAQGIAQGYGRFRHGQAFLCGVFADFELDGRDGEIALGRQQTFHQVLISQRDFLNLHQIRFGYRVQLGNQIGAPIGLLVGLVEAIVEDRTHRQR